MIPKEVIRSSRRFVGAVVNKLQTIANANRELEKYHRTRLQAANASV